MNTKTHIQIVECYESCEFLATNLGLKLRLEFLTFIIYDKTRTKQLFSDENIFVIKGFLKGLTKKDDYGI